MRLTPCTVDGPWPFERVIFTRVRDEDRRPTEWIEIVGEHPDGARSVKVLYDRLWEQMDSHMQWHHGKALTEPHTYDELRHAATRAAVAFLMD